MHHSTPEIVLFYNATVVVQRRIVSGILRYANTFGPWHLTLCEANKKQAIPKNCNGLLACAPSESLYKKLLQIKRPLVLINPVHFTNKTLRDTRTLPYVITDPRAFGVKAADFFLSCSPRTFVYVGGVESYLWDLEREAAFVERLRKAGHEAHIYPRTRKRASQTQEMTRLKEWLKTLPKPLAIFAVNDARAHVVMTACQLAGITIPYEATILGVDNDKLICEAIRPQLSSIQHNAEENGFEAARILDGLMRHELNPKEALPPLNKVIQPNEIIERESTDNRIINDPYVGRALSFIQLNKGLDIRVSDVAQAVGLSPGRIEIRFRQALGTSIIDEISRVRLETILGLIRETNIPFLEIAQHCGFTNASTLCRLVKNATGQSMTALREEATLLSQ